MLAHAECVVHAACRVQCRTQVEQSGVIQVQAFAGDESQLVVLLRAYSVMRLKFAGMWRIPVTKKVRTANLETFERVAAVLNDQVTAPRVWRAQAAGGAAAAPSERPLSALRITSAVEPHGA